MSFWEPWGDYPEAARAHLRRAYPGIWRFAVFVRVFFYVACVGCALVWLKLIAKVMSWP